ncbi:MAG TPA: nuclear transport factor 2 family protein [Solirubrobacteraceae bacterium]|nr:nuclear transport factor 2 family protein [Solirubrobacteraceae bacterium]
MSQENVAVVRDGFERLNAGMPDFSIYHPALVYHPRADEPDPSPHLGREAFERLALGFLESFPNLVFDVEELIDADDLVIASTVMRGQGTASGADVTDAYVFVYRLQAGVVVEGWEYKTREEALKAVGLEK